MPAGSQPPQKRRRLPFNPPNRASSSARPSTSTPKSKRESKAKQSTAKVPSAAAGSSKSKSTSRKSTGKRPRAESPPSSASASDAASDSESGSASSIRSRERSLSQEPDYILAEITTSNPAEDVSSSEPTIPPKLLTRLVHHHFKSEKTKLAKDANPVVAKYVDVFVREAIARAAYERADTEGNVGGGAVADGFLEVEDLEKMAPQLMMDF